MTSLRKLKNNLANSYLVMVCNKSFTNKDEKGRQFTGRLGQKYKYLKEKFSDKYQTKDLKDRLFHGMHPHICKSMRFLYKKPEVTYEELPVKHWRQKKIVVKSSVKSKAAIVENEASPSLQNEQKK